MQLDDVDKLAARAFEGYIVRKDLVRRFAAHYPLYRLTHLDPA